MDKESLFFCRKWFEDYTGGIHSQDSETEANIDLKLAHTNRVRENITNIARSLEMIEGDLNLAQAIAILHDVGRFEQLRDFGSFDDRRTLDHALLGLKVINRSKVLCHLPERDRNLIRKSIWNHNKCRIPENEKTEVVLFSKMIRDADKLDILGIVADHLENRDHHPNRALDLGLADELRLTHDPVSDILQEKMVRIEGMRTIGDLHLMYLSWIFDISFPITMAAIIEKCYLERLLSGISAQPEILSVRDSLQAFLEKRSLRAGLR
ncbi:MAG: HD domain-containing protein [Methanothrix sp.]|nr:HD domain-containing protein [Methanothrix sp.]